MRRVRYRRADLERIAAVEISGTNASPSDRFRWCDVVIGHRVVRALESTPMARIVYDVVLPPRARVTVDIAGISATTGAAASVTVTLDVTGGSTTSSASETITPSAPGRTVTGQRLSVAAPQAGDGRIVLQARLAGEADGVRVLWGAPRIEAPRSWSHWRQALHSTASTWSIAAFFERVRSSEPGERYSRWTRRTARSRREQRAERLWSAGPKPMITLLTWVIDPEAWQPTRAVASLLGQTYHAWEWAIVSPAGSQARVLTALGAAGRDPRVRTVVASRVGNAADAWNDGLGAATGQFVAILGADDALAPEALYEAARAYERWPGADLVYSDEDRLDVAGRRHDPHFKPDWSPDLLLASYYIGRLAVLRADAVRRLEGFRPGYGDAAEWDLVLRLSEVPATIRRITACLYHRNNADVSPETGGGQAVQAHLGRGGLQASMSRVEGAWRAVWPPPRRPLVSIIIPNRNAAALLDRCVAGLRHATAYDRREIVIVDNRSTEPDVLQLYDTLERAGVARIVRFDEPFNFSAACNAGAKVARGELLLFLNNDIEILDPDWLEELVRWALRPEIGVVGPQLLFPDRTIQHAGIVFGLGLVGHIFGRVSENATGLFGSPATYRNYLAVTGACQMMRREVFDQLGGFDEGLRVSFNDVVLCLEARKAGYRVVYTPHAQLVHHESQTRQRDDSPHDKLMLAQYLTAIGFDDDPYGHPELNPRSLIPSLRPPYEPRPSQVVHAEVERTLAADMGGR